MKKNGLKNNSLLLKLACWGILNIVVRFTAIGQTRQVVSTIYDDGVYTCDINILYDQVDFRPDKDVYYYWYRNGHINFNSGNYSGNLLHGEFEKFNYSGSLKEKGNFKFGKKDGMWFFWDTRGEIQKEELWKKGFLKHRRSLQNDTITEESFRNNTLYKRVVAGVNDEIISREKYRDRKLVPQRRFSLSLIIKKAFTKKNPTDETISRTSFPQKRESQDQKEIHSQENANPPNGVPAPAGMKEVSRNESKK